MSLRDRKNAKTKDQTNGGDDHKDDGGSDEHKEDTADTSATEDDGSRDKEESTGSQQTGPDSEDTSDDSQ